MEELETGVFYSGWVHWSGKWVKLTKIRRKGEVRSQWNDDGSYKEARERSHGKRVKNKKKGEKCTLHFIIYIQFLVIVMA